MKKMQISCRNFSRRVKKKPVRCFSFTLHYNNDVLSLTKSKIGDYVDHIYPIDTIDTDRAASYLNYT